jgi:hypothetical protein
MKWNKTALIISDVGRFLFICPSKMGRVAGGFKLRAKLAPPN